MGVFDDIKDSVSGSEEEGSKKGMGPGINNSSSRSNEDAFSSDFGSNNLQNNKGSLNSNQGNAQSRGGQSGRNFPNPQAGRPQKGSDSPQLSSNTKKKMENAGMNPNNHVNGRQQNPGRQGNNRRNQTNQGRGLNQGNRNEMAGGSFENSQGTVSDSRDDFEDLKAQNQQIIELLKRINRNLQ